MDNMMMSRNEIKDIIAFDDAISDLFEDTERKISDIVTNSNIDHRDATNATMVWAEHLVHRIIKEGIEKHSVEAAIAAFSETLTEFHKDHLTYGDCTHNHFRCNYSHLAKRHYTPVK